MTRYGGDDVNVGGEWEISSHDDYEPLTYCKNWQEKALIPYSTIDMVQ